MKGKILQKVLIALLAVVFGTSALQAQVTQKHSFKFDGVEDIEGIKYVVDEIAGVKGELVGDADVVDGVLKLSGGYVEMDENSFDIAQYNGGVSIEMFYKQDPGMSGYRTIFSIGSQNPAEQWMGVNYFQFQPMREDDISRLAICNDNFDNPWTSETSVVGDMYTDTRTHYMVAILTPDAITLYLDGQLAGTEPMTGENHISKVDPKLARLGWTPYTNDPKWLGTIEEFNVYEGEMDAATIEQRFLDYMGENYFNPLLKSLSVTPGEVEPQFDAYNTDYEVVVPFNTRYVTVDAETEIDFAYVTIMDDSGNLYESGERIFIDDNDEYYIDIIAIAADGVTSLDYELAIIRADGATSPHLEKIELSVGMIAEEFESDSLIYTASVPYGTTTVDLIGTAMHGGATVDNSTVDVSSGSGVGEIKVTAEDGESTLTYTVEVVVSKFRADNYFFISSQSFDLVLRERDGDDLNYLSLNHPYLNDDRSYFRFVESGVEGQYYIQNKLGNYISLDKEELSIWNMPLLEETIADSSRFIIDEIGLNQFHIKSVGRIEDGNGKYHMGPNGGSGPDDGVFSDKPANDGNIVWNLFEISELVDPYDTFLESLVIDDIKLYPSFSNLIKDYMLVLADGVTEIDVSATAVDSEATVQGAGTIQLDDEGEFTIKVVAPEAQYFTEYRVRYMREMPFELRHSYTFEDGTARDVVGDAHGTIEGGYIIDGEYFSVDQGDFISLDAEKIAINEYSAVTLELYFTAGDGTNGSNDTAYAFLGSTDSDDTKHGTDYLMIHFHGGPSISCQNTSAPWSVSDGAGNVNVDDGSPHHFVATFTNDSIHFYYDGTLMGQNELRAQNKLFNLKNDVAYLAKSGYDQDPTWKGSIFEYNIYSGVMSAAEIATRSQNFPVEDGTKDVTLVDILLDDESIEDFSPYVYEYVVELEEGDEMPEIDAIATNPEADVEIISADELPGIATIKVTTATSELIYTIEFVIDDEEDGGVYVENVISDNIVVYPTVSEGEFTLATGANSGSYVVYDLAGNAVASGTFAGGDVKINVDNLGVHILQVNVDGKVTTVKIVKR